MFITNPITVIGIFYIVFSNYKRLIYSIENDVPVKFLKEKLFKKADDFIEEKTVVYRTVGYIFLALFHTVTFSLFYREEAQND